LPFRCGALAFARDSRTFAAVNFTNRSVGMWDAATLQPLEQLEFAGTNNSTVALSPTVERWLPGIGSGMCGCGT
jgi:hypothetical protein